MAAATESDRNPLYGILALRKNLITAAEGRGHSKSTLASCISGSRQRRLPSILIPAPRQGRPGGISCRIGPDASPRSNHQRHSGIGHLRPGNAGVHRRSTSGISTTVRLVAVLGLLACASIAIAVENTQTLSRARASVRTAITPSLIDPLADRPSKLLCNAPQLVSIWPISGEGEEKPPKEPTDEELRETSWWLVGKLLDKGLFRPIDFRDFVLYKPETEVVIARLGKDGKPIYKRDDKGQQVMDTYTICGAKYGYALAMLRSYGNDINPKLGDEFRKRVDLELFGSGPRPAEGSERFKTGIEKIANFGSIVVGEYQARPMSPTPAESKAPADSTNPSSARPDTSPDKSDRSEGNESNRQGQCREMKYGSGQARIAECFLAVLFVLCHSIGSYPR